MPSRHQTTFSGPKYHCHCIVLTSQLQTMTPVTPNVRETKHVLTQIKRPHDIIKITNHNAAVKLYDREKKDLDIKKNLLK